MSSAGEKPARARRPRALLIVASDDAAAATALALLRQRDAAFHVTAVVAPDASVSADSVISVPTSGPYGFPLRPALLREARRGYDVAWAVVGDLDSAAYRRAAMLVSLARAREKAAVSADGEVMPLADWLARAHISVGPLALARAGLRRLTAPYRRARAGRLMRGDRPPWGFRRVNIGVSDRCNQRCIMCSEHSPYCADGGRRMAADDVLDERDFGIMPADMYRSLLRDLVAMGTREVELCGLGEPLLHPRLFEMLRLAKERGLWVRLVTNASLLDAEKCRELVALGLDELHISINAGTPETYAQVHRVKPAVFSRVLSAIRMIARVRQESGVQTPLVEASFVVQADNYREPLLWAQAVAEAGVDTITFSALGAAPPQAPVRLTDEQMAEAKKNVAAAVDWATSQGIEVRGTFGALADAGTSFSADLYAYMPCYIGHIFALVTAEGRIHPCCACERVVGDLGEDGFAAAWRGEAYRRFREECLDLPNRLPALEGCSCMSCPYGPWNVEFHQRLDGG